MPDATRPSPGDRGGDLGRLVALPVGERHAAPPNNLPLQLSSFVGREKKLAEIRRLLEERAPSEVGVRARAVSARSTPGAYEGGQRVRERRLPGQMLTWRPTSRVASGRSSRR